MIIQVCKQYKDSSEKIEDVEFDRIERDNKGDIDFEDIKYKAMDYFELCFKNEPLLTKMKFQELIKISFEIFDWYDENATFVDYISIEQERNKPIKAIGVDEGCVTDYYSGRWKDYATGDSGYIFDDDEIEDDDIE